MTMQLNLVKNEEYGVRSDDIWLQKEESGFKTGWQLHNKLRDNKVETLPDVIKFGAKNYSKARCFGTRELIKRQIIEEGGKSLEKLTFGEYKWKSFDEVGNLMNKISKNLLNLEQSNNNRIAIFSETREDWMLTALGALNAGIVVVTLYSTLSDSGIIHGICNTEVETVVVSTDTLKRLKKLLGKCPTVRNVIILEDQLDGVGNILDLPRNIKMVPFRNLLIESKCDEIHIPRKNDVALIMYTSGSSRMPNGVELTHDNIFNSMITCNIQCGFISSDMYLAFLPQAHIFEFCVELSFLATGASIAFSSPFTLTSTSPKIAKGCVGDAVIAKPTKICAVPLILDRIVKGVLLKVSQAKPLKQYLFFEALKCKENNKDSLMSKIWDLLVFKQIRKQLGGNVKSIGVGGAPLSPTNHSMVRAILGCNIQVGYGCTETSGSATSMDINDTRTGFVGAPNPFMMIKLKDWEEGGYLSSDKPYPRGEIVVGGPSVASKYFNNEEESNNAFFEENGVNWFRTGDVGQIDETGAIILID